MGQESNLLDAIERLYAAAAEPALWPEAVEAIARMVGAGHTILFASPGVEAGSPLLVAARVDERDLGRAYAALANCDHGPLTRLPAGTVVARSSLVTDREYARSSHYNEVVRPLNGFHGLVAQGVGPHSAFSIASCRPESADDFDLAQAALLQRLLPHLSTALALRARLGQAQDGMAALAAVIDRLDCGVILVDAAGHPSLINARAAALIERGDGLALGRKGLVGASPPETRRLRDAVLAVTGEGDATERRVSLPRTSGRPPLMLTVLPVGRLGLAIPGLPSPRAAVFVREPDMPGPIDREALAAAYRLTRRESDVASLIGEGVDPAAIADRLNLGLSTVRSHLKGLFAKTGARSQAALVALLRGFVDPVR